MAGKKQAAPNKSSSKGGARTPSTRNPKPNSQQTPTQTTEQGESEEELRRQQILLNIFSATFRTVLEADDFGAQLQEVKAALFNRDFEGAFAREDALDVYAARWSPTRALCYGRVLRGLDSHLKSVVNRSRKHHSPENEIGVQKAEDGREPEHTPAQSNQNKSAIKDKIQNPEPEDQEAPTAAIGQGDTKKEEKPQTLKVLAIGGAAAEIVAFADYISSQNANTPSSTRGEITLLDVGPWGPAVQRLQAALTTTPPISQYASATARAANKALVSPASLHSDFLQKDILSLTREELAALITGQDDTDTPIPILITLLFTLNELYTASGIQRTTSFLRLLSTLVVPGTLLLVVDSPGSYSETAVGKEAKRYPMQWLLDHTLIPPPAKRKPGNGQGEEEQISACRWEKVESHDSVWFRVADGLRYPIPLENMRYQMHLYRASVG